ncbi:7466_t:CDS:2, partial [Cetraspora pellucida]
MSTVDLNMFSLDNTQASQANRNNPTDELDIPEFFQFSKEKYESQKMGRKAPRNEPFKNFSFEDDTDDTSSKISYAELKRQIHIQSEQKRRAEIKDGFEELRKQLPNTSRKMSKSVLLKKVVSHLENQSRKVSSLLDEINRLNQTCIYLNAELEKEKRMNALDRQKRTL